MDVQHTSTSSEHGVASATRAVPAVLTGRDKALLRAVAAGRCDLVGGAAPEIRVDGRWYCDQSRAHDLVVAGLLTALRASGRARGPAALTAAGRHALAG